MKSISGNSGHSRDKVVTISAAPGWLRQHWSRLIAGIALAVVAAVTGRISYIHIEALTLALHQQSPVPRLMPFGVDGLIVVGSVVLLQAAPGKEWLGWLGVAPGVAASVFANVESGLRYGPLAAAWAGVPALFFALATFLLERWLKAQASPVTQAGPAGSPEPETEAIPAAPETGGAGGPEPTAPLTPEAALLALIKSGSRREIAALVGVPKSRVDRLYARLTQTGEAGPEAVQDGPDEAPEAAVDAPGWPLNGAVHEPAFFSTVPRLRRIGEDMDGDGGAS